MTLGSMLVLAAIAAILPGGVLLGRHTADPDVSAVDKRLGHWLTILGNWIERHPWRLLGIWSCTSGRFPGSAFRGSASRAGIHPQLS